MKSNGNNEWQKPKRLWGTLMEGYWDTVRKANRIEKPFRDWLNWQ